MASADPTGVEDPRFAAAVTLIGRTGAENFQIRYQDDEQPVIWMAVGVWHDGAEVGAGMTPLQAAMRLLDQVIDGGLCIHCQRPTGVTDDWKGEMPLSDMLCWYRYDPEMQEFRRGCSGDEELYTKVGRNDPCPCGSGKKLKHCHGAPRGRPAA